MAGKTSIEWTRGADGSEGMSWNPVAGCTVLTPGCTNCYAMKMAARLAAMGQPLYAGLTKSSKAGPVWTGVMRQAPEATLLAPLKRKKPTTYFVNSMSDLFHENVPDEWIDAVFAVMALTPQHKFQVLTKRAARMRDYCTNMMTPTRLVAAALKLPQGEVFSATWPLPNVWKGVSTERQQEADERIPLLLQTPAAVRFISAEPLLGPIRLDRLIREESGKAYVDDALTGFVSNGCGGTYKAKLSWVIAGAESGHGARPCAIEWVRAIKDQCVAAGVPFFWKQHANNRRREEVGGQGVGPMSEPIDFIDAGAAHTEPVTEKLGLTQGHLREWHDEAARKKAFIARLKDDCDLWAQDHEDQGKRLVEEIQTVNRVWRALGISTFEAAGGLTIFEIVARQRAALERVHHTLSVHGKIDAHTELHAFVQTAIDPTAPQQFQPGLPGRRMERDK